MKSSLEQVKKEVMVALGINFGLIAILGVLLFMLPKGAENLELVGIAANIFMIIPCFAAMITMKYVAREKFNKEEENFVKWIIVAGIIAYIGAVITLVIKEAYIGNLILVAMEIVSIVLIIKTFKHGEKLERFNLRFKKNIGWVIKTVGIFIGLKLGLIAVGVFLLKEEISTDLGMALIMLPIGLVINMFFAFFMFLGEEFGWRYYLQPRLQRIFGKKLGVIILGAIWGIWHLPLCFILYSPQTPLYCVAEHLIYCITLGIFLGFVYMKTENLFALIIIHLVNNVLAVTLNNGSYEMVLNMKTLISGAIINILMFGIFIFAKEYKKGDSGQGTIGKLEIQTQQEYSKKS